MKKILIAAALLAGLAVPVSAGSWTATGSNGGSASGSRSCERGNGAATCQSSSLWTGPNGNTATRARGRTTTADGTTFGGSATGFAGRSRSWTGSIRR